MNVINLIKQKMIKTPWLKYYQKDERKIKIEDISIYQLLEKSSIGREKNIAINYYGKQIHTKTSYIKSPRLQEHFAVKELEEGM